MQSLLLLACPVGMGLMMFFMMRGGKGSQEPSAQSPADLRARQAGIAAELERREREEAGPGRVG